MSCVCCVAVYTVRTVLCLLCGSIKSMDCLVSDVWLYIQYGLSCVCCVAVYTVRTLLCLYIQYGLSCVYCVAVYTVRTVLCLLCGCIYSMDCLLSCRCNAAGNWHEIRKANKMSCEWINFFCVNLVNDQLDAQFFYFIIRPLQPSTCFEQRRVCHQEVEFY